MLDAHTHLNSDQLYPDRQQYFRNFCDIWGTWLVNIWVNQKRNQINLDIQAQRQELKKNNQDIADISCTLGLHPCETVFWNIKNGDILHTEYSILEDMVEKNKHNIVAIWECGIDAHHDWNTNIRDLQIELLHRQCLLARTHNLPIVIHSRSQRDITIEVLKSYTDLKINLHCRSYSTTHIKEAMDLFPHLRIWYCGNITYKKAIDIQESFSYFAEAGGRYLLETDAPYLSPQKVRGKQNEPAYIIHTYDRISQKYHIDLDVLQSKIREHGKLLYTNPHNK